VDTNLDLALAASTLALETAGLPYAIVGGLAVSAWALPRSTRDVDLYVEMPSSMKSALQAELELRGFHVPALAAELQQFGVFRSKHLATGVFVDIFDAVGPLGASILERRQLLMMNSRKHWIVSPEDLVLLKAFSDRPRDFEDLVTLFAHLNSKLEHAYIDEWARLLDSSIGTREVSERIHRARSRAERSAT
jgi:predicted nucleotidyltransferase